MIVYDAIYIYLYIYIFIYIYMIVYDDSMFSGNEQQEVYLILTLQTLFCKSFNSCSLISSRCSLATSSLT